MRSQHYDRAQRALDEAAAVAEATGQHSYDAEHARMQAELISARGGPAERADEMYRRHWRRPSGKARAGSSCAPPAATPTFW